MVDVAHCYDTNGHGLHVVALNGAPSTMSHFDTAAPFRSRLAPGFEGNPKNDLLYEVVTAEGERIASASNEVHTLALAGVLNEMTRRWVEMIGFDAVVG